jgi:hypothetical protein
MLFTMPVMINITGKDFILRLTGTHLYQKL